VGKLLNNHTVNGFYRAALYNAMRYWRS